MVLQALHGLSDREAVVALRTDLRCKLATGLRVGHGGFDPSTLTYRRKRLEASQRLHRIAVATQDTVRQLIGVIRKVR